ncbi:MAG: hypothetical protein U0136_01635 [Bdellovibrionota bacterium]
MLRKTRLSLFTLIISGALVLGGCSPSSLVSQEGALGTGFGFLGGTGAGYLIGQQIGKKTENMALVGALGGGLGALAGGMLHERNVAQSNAKRAVVREARAIDENQRRIDEMRERMSDASTWGRSEVKPWNERYLGDSYDSPYEGPLRP